MTTSTQTQLRRGTHAQVVAMTPVVGEAVVDTTNKRVNLGDGSTAGGIPQANAADVQNQTFTAGTVGGTADAITLTNYPVVAAYATNQRFVFKATGSNTTAVTLAVDGLTAKNVKKMIAGTLTALSANDITGGGLYEVYYDGTQFQIKGLDETVGSSGSLILLSTQTASASATLDFTSVLSATYIDYLFEIDNLRPANDGKDLYMRLSVDNGANFLASGYTSAMWYYASAAFGTAAGGASAMQLTPAAGGEIGNAAAEGVSGQVMLFTPGNATQAKRASFDLGISDKNAATPLFSHGVGSQSGTAAVNAVRFLFDTGNITSGVIRCYGIKAS
jgi:hypothetical protein